MELMDGRYVPPNGSFIPFLAKSCQAVTGQLLLLNSPERARVELALLLATIGLDFAKLVFRVHGVDGSGYVLVRRRLSRASVLRSQLRQHLMLYCLY